MIFKMVHVLKGNLIWHYLKVVNNINYHSIIIVLTGENSMVDRYAIQYLEAFVNRRSADKVFIWTKDGMLVERLKKKYTFQIKKLNASEKMLKAVFDYYCYDNFFANLVFTYINAPEDNQIGKLLLKSDVNEEDIVCLGLYNLRMVPTGTK